jgi:hypothetical protein
LRGAKASAEALDHFTGRAEHTVGALHQRVALGGQAYARTAAHEKRRL